MLKRGHRREYNTSDPTDDHSLNYVVSYVSYWKCIFQTKKYVFPQKYALKYKIQTDKFAKCSTCFSMLRSVQRCVLCRSRRERSNECLVLVFTWENSASIKAENEPSKVWPACLPQNRPGSNQQPSARRRCRPTSAWRRARDAPPARSTSGKFSGDQSK